MKILIVDDEPGIRDLLSQEFKYQHHDVKTAIDGQDALDHLKKEGVDLVLCDVNMPRMSGLDFLQALRHTGNHCPVIMMTGFGTVEMAVSAMKNGAHDFIQKPFTLDELTSLVNKIAAASPSTGKAAS